MIKKSLYLIFIFLAVVSCKKNEEKFTISSDILNPIIEHPSIPDIYDIPSLWNGDRLLIRTSSELVATGEKINATEHTKKIFDKEIGFAETNLKHNFSGATKIEDWLVINNDEIMIESDAFFYGATPTYFDVEITESDYNGLNSVVAQLGTDLATTLDPNYAAFVFNLFPKGKIQRLRLTMDYNFLSSDQTQRSREYREYHFYRLKPQGGFKFTTLEKYE